MTHQPSDKSKFHNALYEGSNREHVGRRLDLVGATTAFQADDEGSIPFTRSSHFKLLAATGRSIPTSGLLLIPTNHLHLFVLPAVSVCPMPPAAWSA
jgi:hypothetical protein